MENQGQPGAPVGRYAWYVLILFTLIYTCHYIDRSIIAILIEPIKAEFSLSDTQIGLLTGLAFGLIYACAGIPLGMLIDRINRRNLFAVLITVWSAATALCGLAQNYTSLLAARLFVGMAEAGASPTAMSMLTDLFPPHKRSFAVGFFWASTAIGGATAFAVGGLVAAHFGWRVAFFVAGVPGLILAILLVLTVREPKRGAMDPAYAANTGGGADAAPGLLEMWREASSNKMFVLTFIGMMTNSIVGSGIMVWEAAYLVRVHGFDLVQAGLTVGLVVMAFGATGTAFGGFAGDRLTKRRGLSGAALVPAISGVFTAVAGLCIALAASPILGVAAIAFWEFSYRTYFGPGNNLLLTNVQPRMRGVAASFSQATTNLIGWGMGPLIIGVVSDYMGGGTTSLRWGIAAVVIFSLITAGLFFAASRCDAGRAGETLKPAEA